jgi:diaminobutyrate-2-oxoglutarate transaminase
MVGGDVSDASESSVRLYSRLFPAVFAHAKNCRMYDVTGQAYLDFFSGAGALNFGHNNDRIKRRVIEALTEDRVVHALDMLTPSRVDFLRNFRRCVLAPAGIEHRVQFCGPTGTNAVEAALRLARKWTGRRRVVYFSGSFHGMTQGSLSVSSGKESWPGSLPSPFAVETPFDGPASAAALGELVATMEREGEPPAAIILETIQGKGGVNVASAAWLQEVRAIADRFGILVIVDDVQVGCGRTGRYLSFEDQGLVPDIVCLSKSLSGFGLPLALVLIRPDLPRSARPRARRQTVFPRRQRETPGLRSARRDRVGTPAWELTTMAGPGTLPAP